MILILDNYDSFTYNIYQIAAKHFEDTIVHRNDDITLGEAELHLIKTALERTNRNVSKAARELGITRMALRYRIRKYNL